MATAAQEETSAESERKPVWSSGMKWPAAVVLIIVAVALGGVIGYSVAKNRPVELQLQKGDQKAVLRIGADGGVDYEKVLATFFEKDNEWLRGAAKAWLQEKQGIVSVSEAQLALLLQEKACGEFKVAVDRRPQSPDAYFKDLENRVRCASLPNVSALRSLPRDGKPPFHDVRELLNATVPERDAQPLENTVNVCKSNRALDGVKLELVSPNRVDPTQFKPLVRLARARMDCGESSFTAMHLRPEDATSLTGEQRPNMPVVVFYSRVSPGSP